MGGVVQNGVEGRAQPVRGDPAELHPESGPRVHDLGGDHRLVVADGGGDQRDAVPQRLAHGVVPGVADHRVHPLQQGELGHGGQHQQVLAAVLGGQYPARVDEDGLHPVGAFAQRLAAGGEEAAARVGVGGAQGDQDLRPAGVSHSQGKPGRCWRPAREGPT